MIKIFTQTTSHNVNDKDIAHIVNDNVNDIKDKDICKIFPISGNIPKILQRYKDITHKQHLIRV